MHGMRVSTLLRLSTIIYIYRYRYGKADIYPLFPSVNDFETCFQDAVTNPFECQKDLAQKCIKSQAT